MPAITIRNLPEVIHAALKQQAAASNRSVEAHVRAILAAQAEASTHPVAPTGAPHMVIPPQGFAEAPLPWGDVKPASPHSELWGALRGTVNVAPSIDLAEPLEVAWEAANG